MFVVCDWCISIPFVSFCVSRFVACDLNDVNGSEKRNHEGDF